MSTSLSPEDFTPIEQAALLHEAMCARLLGSAAMFGPGQDGMLLSGALPEEGIMYRVSNAMDYLLAIPARFGDEGSFRSPLEERRSCIDIDFMQPDLSPLGTFVVGKHVFIRPSAHGVYVPEPLHRPSVTDKPFVASIAARSSDMGYVDVPFSEPRLRSLYMQLTNPAA